jgi:hypothetical protein
LKAVWCDRTLAETPYDFCLCTTDKQYQREMDRLKLPKKDRTPFLMAGSNATLHTWDNTSGGRPLAMVCIGDRKGKTLMQTYAVLVHEAVHLWQFTKERMGEDKPSPEFEAYAVQAISQRLFYAYDDLTKRKKKCP